MMSSNLTISKKPTDTAEYLPLIPRPVAPALVTARLGRLLLLCC